MYAAGSAEVMRVGAEPGSTPRRAAAPSDARAVETPSAVSAGNPPSSSNAAEGAGAPEATPLPVPTATRLATAVRSATLVDGGNGGTTGAGAAPGIDKGGVDNCRSAAIAASAGRHALASTLPGKAVRDARAVDARPKVASSRVNDVGKKTFWAPGVGRTTTTEGVPTSSTATRVTLRFAALARPSAAAWSVAESDVMAAAFAAAIASDPGAGAATIPAADVPTSAAAKFEARTAPWGLVFGSDGPPEPAATCTATAPARVVRVAGSVLPAAASGEMTLAFASAMPMPPSCARARTIAQTTPAPEPKAGEAGGGRRSCNVGEKRFEGDTATPGHVDGDARAAVTAEEVSAAHPTTPPGPGAKPSDAGPRGPPCASLRNENASCTLGAPSVSATGKAVPPETAAEAATPVTSAVQRSWRVVPRGAANCASALAHAG